MENQNKNSLLGLNQVEDPAKNVVGSMAPLVIKEPTKTNIEAPELLKIESSQIMSAPPELLKPLEYSPAVTPVNTNLQVTQKTSQITAPETIKIQSPEPTKMPEIQLSAENKPTANALEAKNKELADLKNKTEEMSSRKNSMKTIEMLKPAFANVEQALKFTASLNQKRDFDDQHFTVPTTQSLFNMTANQISNFPAWRK